jgi:hypothetical protein
MQRFNSHLAAPDREICYADLSLRAGGRCRDVEGPSSLVDRRARSNHGSIHAQSEMVRSSYVRKARPKDHGSAGLGPAPAVRARMRGFRTRFFCGKFKITWSNFYASRRASIGSTFDARRAGSHAAARLAVRITSATMRRLTQPASHPEAGSAGVRRSVQARMRGFSTAYRTSVARFTST